MSTFCKYCPVFNNASNTDISYEMFMDAIVQIVSNLSQRYKAGKYHKYLYKLNSLKVIIKNM